MMGRFPLGIPHDSNFLDRSSVSRDFGELRGCRAERRQGVVAPV
jgi:hypothetical protein